MRYSWIFLLAIFTFVPCKESIALDAKELFKNSKGSVVLIMSFDSNNQPLAIGSGFYVDDGRKIATNLHVISGAQVVRIKNPNGKVFRASILLGVDSTHDLALLEADVSGNPIPLSKRTPEIVEDVIHIRRLIKSFFSRLVLKPDVEGSAG